MYNILERLEHFKFNFDDDPEISYLKESQIINVINRGLADVYDSQPKNPINFLANWLLVESNGKEIKKVIEAEDTLKAATKQIVNFKMQKIEEHKKNEELKYKKIEDEKESLLEKIKTCTNFEASINELCDEIKLVTKSTGVYFGIYDNKRKAVKIDDDENAHLMNSKVIRYIGYCKDHDFLKFKFLDTNTGVTLELFTLKKTPKNNAANENDSEETENELNKKAKNDIDFENNSNVENEIFKEYNFTLINEVVRNPKIKFFREPRLGCYLAVEIAINSSLSSTSLYSAMENLITYNTKLREYEARKEEYLKSRPDTPKENNNNKKNENEADKPKTVEGNDEQLNINQNASMEQQNLNNSNINKLNNSGANAQNASGADVKNNSGVNNDNLEEDNEAGFPEENIVLEDYVRTEKKFVLCLDTLGQDRVYNVEEKKLIFELTKILKKSWEELEKTLLLKDRDLRIEQMEKENMLRQTTYVEKLENDEEKYIKENMQSEKYAIIEDAIEKANYTELFKARFLIFSIQEEPQMMELFKLFSQYEVIVIIKVYLIYLQFFLYNKCNFSLLNLKN